MRVLILGGTLFIGRRIALELLARGDDVMVVHRGQTEPPNCPAARMCTPRGTPWPAWLISCGFSGPTR